MCMHLGTPSSRYQHAADLAALLTLDHDQLRDVELTDDQGSGFVARWNRLAVETRRARRKRCVQAGHFLVRLSSQHG